MFSSALEIVATDRAGNAATTTFTAIRDAGAPQASVTVRVQGDYVVVNWSASDPGSGLDTCRLQMRENRGEWTRLSSACVGGTIYTNVRAGRSYTFRLQATDRVSNAASESASLVYNGEPPQVSVNATFSDDHIDVHWNASDSGSDLGACTLEMSADGRTWEDLSDNCTGTIVPADVLAGQPYTFRLTATDNTGNTASAEDGAATAAVTKYYYFGGQRVAVRKPDGAVNWLHGDHLGSASLATDGNGEQVSRQLYYPFGEVRWASAEMPTDFGFTGQRNASTIGLYDYHARFYDPFLGRFISADSLVPSPASPQSFNRYSYVRNRPIQLIDPSGHDEQTVSGDNDFVAPIKYFANVEYRTYQLRVSFSSDGSFDIHLTIRQKTVPAILLAAAMDRQNAARPPVIGGIEEFIRSMLPSVHYSTGDKASIGPANIEMREIRRWVERGWIDAQALDYVAPLVTFGQVWLIDSPEFAVGAMQTKLREADCYISFFGGDVNPAERFMLLMIAQNNLGSGRIQNFFEEGATKGWINILNKDTNRDQLREMMENILRLQNQGWALPAGVDLWDYWNNTLGPAIQNEYEDLYNAVEAMK